MTTARIGTNMKIEVESTLGTAITDATGITKANPGVVTTTGAHGLTTGDVVLFVTVDGMVELEGQAVRVTVLTATTFELESLDTTDYSTFTSASIQEVTAWLTIAGAQSCAMPTAAGNKIDVTVLLDKTKKYQYGLPDAPDGTIGGLYDPLDPAIVKIKAATKANGDLVHRITWAGGQKTIFNALVSGGPGFDLQQNAAATTTISFTPVGDPMDYAS